MANALGKTSAYMALLFNGEKQILPVSKARLIELSAAIAYSNVGISVAATDSVQVALEKIAGAVEQTRAMAYTYTGSEINKLNSDEYGAKKAQDAQYGTKYISYLYEQDGIIYAEDSTLNASAVAYSGAQGRSNVNDELTYLNNKVSEFAADAELKVTYTGMDTNSEYDVVIRADGKEYTLTQGSSTIAKFNVEKDSFVQEGTVIAGSDIPTADQADITGFNSTHTYIKLVIKEAGENGNVDKTLYIDANTLVDSYQSGSSNGDMVYVNVDNSTNQITAYISDGTVTKAKLVSGVQTSLDRADTSVQAISNKSGSDLTFTYTTATGSPVDVILTASASSVTVDLSGNDNSLASLLPANAQTTDYDDVQSALQLIASSVNTLDSAAVKSITGDSDDANYVTVSAGTKDATGNVALTVTTTLGNVATLNYEGKDISDTVTDTFYNAIA